MDRWALSLRHMLLLRYLIQRKQNGTDGNAFSYEAGPNATDEFEGKGGVDAYIEQVIAFNATADHGCTSNLSKV